METGIKVQKGAAKFYLRAVLSESPDILYNISLIAGFGSYKKFPWGHIDSVLRFYFIVLSSALRKEMMDFQLLSVYYKMLNILSFY